MMEGSAIFCTASNTTDINPMPITAFPPLESALPSGLLAIGGDLSVPSLLLAYRSGVFPWPHDDHELLWFSPPTRTILFFKDLRIPRSLKKELRRTSLSFRMNTACKAVIERCSELYNRGDQSATWITPGMKSAYEELHRAGYCISFESWRSDALVAGVYGVLINRFFAGESMFYREPNGSKIALIRGLAYLEEQGVEWMDCQMSSALVMQLGAREVGREQYGEMLQGVVG